MVIMMVTDDNGGDVVVMLKKGGGEGRRGRGKGRNDGYCGRMTQPPM